MLDPNPNKRTQPWPALALAAAGALVCLVTTYIVWRGIAQNQSMWPLPGLYLLETDILATLPLAGMLGRLAFKNNLAWACAGALTGFCLLGAWSVGFFYLPVALLLALSGLAAGLAEHKNLLPGLVFFLAASAVQAALMLTVISFI